MAEWLDNLRCVRAEVRRAVRKGVAPAPACADAVTPADLPSVATRGAGDRLVAEIDHDGFAFAATAEDTAVFPSRAERLPRTGNLVDVVLLGGRVAIRKRFRPPGVATLWSGRVRARDWAYRRAWNALGVHFYAEVTALLRLRDVPFVPRLLDVDVGARTVWIDCLAGQSLRHAAALGGEAIHDADLPATVRRSEAEIGRHESRLLDATAGPDWRAEVTSMVEQMVQRGVVPLDVKLGNLIRGRRTSRLYWIDFENARIEGQPGFARAVAHQRQLLEDHFGIDPSRRTPPAPRLSLPSAG